MTAAVFAIPGDLSLPTGGYGYDRRVLALLPRAGIDVRHLPLPGSFPFPGAADLALTERRLRDIDPRAVLMIDGLAYGAMPAALIESLRNPILALVHHPLGLEAGLDARQQAALLASEAAALAHAGHVVVTSSTTAATLTADFAVPAGRITVAIPGTDPAPRAPRTLQAASGMPLELLAVGSVVARKAYDTLVRALAPLQAADWQLTIVGALDFDAAAATALRAAIRETGLESRVALAGAAWPEAVARHYASADIFVASSLYEGYGMALAEALARGLPIVCTTGGAAAATVPDAAALKIPPGNERALGEALGRVMGDPVLRRSLSDAAWSAAAALPRWEDTARSIAGAIETIGRKDCAT